MGWVYGISSKIPDSSQHYFFSDIDTTDPNLQYHALKIIRSYFPRKPSWVDFSPHGLHAVVFSPDNLDAHIERLQKIPEIDKKWLSIGKRRGYLFLITYRPIFPPMPLTMMRINVTGTQWWKDKNAKA